MVETQQVDPGAAPNPPRIEGNCLAIASPTSISEACFSVPAIRAIQHARPDLTLVILAPDNIAPIWRRIPKTPQILTYPSSDSPRKIAKILNQCGLPFDSSITWDENPAALAFAKIEIPQRLGYPTQKIKKLLTHPVHILRKIGPIEHQVNHYLLFLNALGIDPFHPSNFQTPERPAPSPNFRVAIVPGSDFGPAAEWPLPNFLELTRAIAQQCELVILPSPGRPQPAEALAQDLGNPGLVANLEGDELIDFLATCQGLVGNDGSLPHLASLVGTPSLVLFGPNEPEWKRPLGKIHRILHHREACSSCLLTKCPLDHRCLAGITPAEALEELRILFKG